MVNAVLVGAFAALMLNSAGATPLKVKTHGTKSQSVFMCADCKSKVSCAKVGDYIVGLVVDVDSPKLGGGQLVAHVQDADKHPVNDAKVVVTLSMPAHKHAGKPIALKSRGHGEYAAKTNTLGMSGGWLATVAVTPKSGDTVKQVFAFAK
jgi:hypothetical protein